MGGEEAIAAMCQLCAQPFGFASYSRLDGGCAAEEERSPSSLARLLRLLVGAGPRFAEDMLGRRGELELGQDDELVVGRTVVASWEEDLPHCSSMLICECRVLREQSRGGQTQVKTGEAGGY